MAATTSYPSAASEEEWAVALPYLALLRPIAWQRKHDLRAVVNSVRYLAHTGVPWRYLPGDFPPRPAVYQQLRRWLAAGSFEAPGHDTRLLLRTLTGRFSQPSAVIVDARVLQSTPESGKRGATAGASSARDRRSTPPSIRWALPWR
jgi:transposase